MKGYSSFLAPLNGTKKLNQCTFKVWRGVDSHMRKGPNSTCLRSPINREKLVSLTPPMSSVSLLVHGHGGQQ